MPQPTFRNLVLPLLFIAAVAGCSKQSGEAATAVTNPAGGSTTTAAAEQAAVAQTMSEQPQLVEDAIAEDGATFSLDSGVVPGATAAIRPVNFWRRIDHVERAFELAFADTDSTGRPTTAFVTVHKRLTGTFNILAGDPPPPPTLATGELPPPPPRDTTLRVVHKPLADHWVRRLVLKRAPRPAGDGDELGDDRPRWRIAATSGVQVTSRDAATRIVSVRIQSGDRDTTITDALALFRLRQVLRFAGGASVNLTVTTLRNDDVVLLHMLDRRARFHNNGDNTYSATFVAGGLGEVRHFGIDALSHGTLFDDAAPYDSQAWILPFVVAPTQLAQFMP